MERDNFQRFKRHITSRCDFADRAWRESNLKPDERMPLKKFRAWAKANPGIFSFLDELQIELSKFIHLDDLHVQCEVEMLTF